MAGDCDHLVAIIDNFTGFFAVENLDAIETACLGPAGNMANFDR